MKRYFFALILLFTPLYVIANRFSIEPFVPERVTVADGYLQIRLPYFIDSELCENTNQIVLEDSHKYFEAYLSLATTAFVTNKRILVAVSDPCLGSPKWFQISNVMHIVN